MYKKTLWLLFFLFSYPLNLGSNPTWPLPKLSLIPMNGFFYDKVAYAMAGQTILRLTLSEKRPVLKKVYQFPRPQSLAQSRMIRSGVVISTFDSDQKVINFLYIDNNGKLIREEEVRVGVKIKQYSFRLDKYGNPILLFSGSFNKRRSLVLLSGSKRLNLYKPAGEIEKIYLGGSADQAHCIFRENKKKYWFVQAPGGILQGQLSKDIIILAFFPAEKGDKLLVWSRKSKLFSIFYWEGEILKRHQLTTEASGLPEGLSWGMAGERITFSFYDSSESKIRTLTLNLSLEAQLQEIGMFPARSKVNAVREFFLLETLDSPSVYFYKPGSPCQLVGSDYSYKDQRLKVTLDTGKSKITAVQYLLNQKMMTEPIPPDRPFRRSLIFPFIPAVDHYLHLRLICGEVERRYHIAIPLFTGLPKPDFYELNPQGLNRFLYGPTSITSKENKSDILYYRFSELSKEERAYKKRGKFVIKAPQYADVNDLILRLYDKEKGIFSQEARFKLQYFQKGSIQERLDYIDTELDTSKDSAKKLRELDKQIEKLEKELN